MDATTHQHHLTRRLAAHLPTSKTRRAREFPRDDVVHGSRDDGTFTREDGRGGAAARASSGGVDDDDVATSVLDAAAQETSLDVRQAASFEVVEHALLVRVGEGVGVAEEVRLGRRREDVHEGEHVRVFRSPRAVNLGVFLGRARAVALSGRGGLVVEDVLRMEARPRELGRGSNGGGHAVLVQGFGFGKVDDVEEHLLVGAMIARAEVEPQAVPRGARVVANRELVLALGEHLARAEVAALKIRRELRGVRRRKRRGPGTPTRAAKDGRRARENGVRGATTLSTPGASDERVAFAESCSATMDIAGG